MIISEPTALYQKEGVEKGSMEGKKGKKRKDPVSHPSTSTPYAVLEDCLLILVC
jgi:hypothetical protein